MNSTMNSTVMKIVSKSPEETFTLGKGLSIHLKENDVVALYGDLGSGKTVIVQGICEGLYVTEYVTSPSFTLIQEYQGRLPVYHFDFYRLTSIQEVEDLGIDHYFNQQGISLIEWPEVGEMVLPHSHFTIKIQRIFKNGTVEKESRSIQITSPQNRGVTL